MDPAEKQRQLLDLVKADLESYRDFNSAQGCWAFPPHPPALQLPPSFAAAKLKKRTLIFTESRLSANAIANALIEEVACLPAGLVMGKGREGAV